MSKVSARKAWFYQHCALSRGISLGRPWRRGAYRSRTRIGPWLNWLKIGLFAMASRPALNDKEADII
jgi:hypothetical protein